MSTNFAVLDFPACATPVGGFVTATTDIPVLLTLRLSKIPPVITKVPRLKRGVWVGDEVSFCFVAYHDFPSLEREESIHHSFHIFPWAREQIQWYYFHATISGVPSVSTSAFTSFFPPKVGYDLLFIDFWRVPPPPLFILAFEESWTLPEPPHLFTLIFEDCWSPPVPPAPPPLTLIFEDCWSPPVPPPLTLIFEDCWSPPAPPPLTLIFEDCWSPPAPPPLTFIFEDCWSPPAPPPLTLIFEDCWSPPAPPVPPALTLIFEDCWKEGI